MLQYIFIKFKKSDATKKNQLRKTNKQTNNNSKNKNKGKQTPPIF